jgi:hypothetical protein
MLINAIMAAQSATQRHVDIALRAEIEQSIGNCPAWRGLPRNWHLPI